MAPLPLEARYRLLRFLGQGATSRVYLGEEAESGEHVVLKVASDRKFAPILAAEAVHAHLVASPRMPRLRGFGLGMLDDREEHLLANSQGAPCVAFDWSAGTTLDSLAPSPSLALAVARELAEALADLHDLGLAHGDLKPSNVLVGERGASLLDWGSVREATSLRVDGATPRYLGRGDPELGDARARDLLALGLLIAELLDPTLRAESLPLPRARILAPSSELARVVLALLAPAPSARPSARSVLHSVRNWVRGDIVQGHDAERDLRLVRTSYLRLRRHELGAERAREDVAPFLHETLAFAARAMSICRTVGTETPEWLEREHDVLEPLDPHRRERWAATLAGLGTASWRHILHTPTERDLTIAFETLARRYAPASWTAMDLDSSLQGDTIESGRSADVLAATLGDDPTPLALALGQLPVPARVLDEIERRAEVLPEALVDRAIDSLRLAGALGRARRLMFARVAATSARAEVLRRIGELEESTRVATEVVLREGPDAGRARAILARLAFDRGDVEEAALHLSAPASAHEHEVAALLASRRGEHDLAVKHAALGLALARDDEQRARLVATQGYVIHPASPLSSRRSFAEAADHAARAGALLEEATYRTGEAAAALDLGLFEEADAASRRAILLFEDVLERPLSSTRAWLVRAALAAARESESEAKLEAREVVRRGEHDPRAVRYAQFCIADAAPAGAGSGRTAAEAGLEPLAGHASSGGAALDDDDLRALARAHRHGVMLPLDARLIEQRVATGSSVAQLEWWHARAERLLTSGAPAGHDDMAIVLAELDRLTEVDGPLVARGRAMHIARDLAFAAGDRPRAERFEEVRRTAANAAVVGESDGLKVALRRCAWMSSKPPRNKDSEPALLADGLDLERLVRALGEREDLDALLVRVLDVLLEWTSAERGLLLLLRANGKFVPRAARQLQRKDLSPDQLAVSMSLAERAVKEARPVVAVDAMNDLADSHESVVALALRSILVVPLRARGETLGVVYLDDRHRTGAFGPRELGIASTIAPIAAVAIADSRRQAALERARRRAERAMAVAERTLARREAALATAEGELRRPTADRRTRFAYGEILGHSEVLGRLLTLVDRIAPSDLPVLIQGESGTGKELVARAIHRHSQRSGHPFVTENCAALPETLLESLLFGHVRGAFTGAHRTQVGLFEAAAGGTLFLDEIGEMSLTMQTKLLRVLEDGVVRPIGAERGRRVDVRLVAATHRDLRALVERGQFREDLLYRLDVARLHVPPLRDRPDDIPILVQHFVLRHTAGRDVRITADALEALARRPWAGNVRELENEVRRALIACDDLLDTVHLSPIQSPLESRSGQANETMHLRTRIDALEADLIAKALRTTGGNQTRAAELLGLSRFGLHKLLKRLGLKAR